MHPVPGRRLAAEHIEAMTAAAGTPSWSPAISWRRGTNPGQPERDCRQRAPGGALWGPNGDRQLHGR